MYGPKRKRGEYKKYLKESADELELPRQSQARYDDEEGDKSRARKRLKATVELHEREDSDDVQVQYFQAGEAPDASENDNDGCLDEGDFMSTSTEGTDVSGSGDQNSELSTDEMHSDSEGSPDQVHQVLDDSLSLEPTSDGTNNNLLHPVTGARPEPFLQADDPNLHILRNHEGEDPLNPEEQNLCDEEVPNSSQPASAEPDYFGDSEETSTFDVYCTNDDQPEASTEAADMDQSFAADGGAATTTDQPKHEQLRNALNLESFTSTITSSVNASPAEAMLMTLALAEQNHLTFKTFCDMVKLVNSLFSTSVIPGSQHLLDKLLMCDKGLERDFYCKKCTHLFGKIDHEKNPEIVCPEEHCKTVNVIKDLTQATYFVIFSVISQLELLFMKDGVWESLGNPQDLVGQNQPGVMKDLHGGRCYRAFVSSLPNLPNVRIISFTICTDGSPLFKSSSFSIWPVYLCLNELPPNVRMRNVMLTGLWWGNRHPPMDLLLEPVVSHLKSLSNCTFEILINNEKVQMRAFTLNCCVDSGARGAVQGINSHSGYYSCNWCEIPGQYYEHRVVFPFEENPSRLRTHADLLHQANQCVHDEKLFYVYGTQFLSPLATLPKFDIIEGMVQDFLHNVPFGIGRVFLDEWLSNSSRSFYIGSPDELKIMNQRISCITPCIEVRRPVRSLSVHSYWNAREYENWIIFFSIPVLSGVLPQKFYEHWVCFVQAVYLVSRMSVTFSNVNTAHKLFVYFVANVEAIYGKKYMTFNVHILSHLAQNVARWGPTWAVSTYCFEAAIGVLKRLLHAQRGVPHQVQRAISYKEAKNILLDKCKSPKVEAFLAGIVAKPSKMTMYLPLKECVALGKLETFVPDREEEFLIRQFGCDIDLPHAATVNKIISKRCVFTVESLSEGKKFNNSFALLLSGDIVLLKKIIVCRTSEQVYVLCVKVLLETFLKFPSQVRICPGDHCVRMVSSIGRRLILKSIADLDIVCVRTSIADKMYISAMHNTYNVC